MANIKVKDLTDTSSISLDNEMMVLTNDTTNLVQNITVENLLTSVLSTDVDNVLEQDVTGKLFVENPENITGELTNLTTTNKTNLVSAINEVDGDIGNLSNLTTTTKTSVVGAVNEVDGDIGDLSNLTTVDKSSIVNAINELEPSNGATKSLNNLDTTGEARLHALKAYADNGELLTDAEGLSDVKKYAHSTFDLSKFTVVGSPNITDDGIASGFSNENYITAGNYDLTNAKTFKFNFSYSLGAYSWNCICGFGVALYFERMGNNSVRLSWWENGISYQLQSLINIPQNVYCDYEIEVTNSNMLYCRWKPSNDNTWTQEESLDVSSIRNIGTSLTLYIGKYGSGLPDTTGSIDLKQFSITVDGVEVFSGNKTGIDTIKPDDYTVVGSPTITNDGILTYSDKNKFLKIPDFDYTKPFEIYFRINKTDTSNSRLFNFNNSDTDLRVFYDSNTTKYTIAFWLNNSSVAGTSAKQLSLNVTYDIKFVYTGTNYSIYYKLVNDENYTLLAGADNSSTITTNDNATIGGNTVNYAAFYGQFDLNAFKVYVDGDLVYQPCLKIPYTKSKTGSKIVDSIYRNRVNDMAEQFGFANYYTLSDTDFTLPQVELYGMIERNLNVDRPTSEEVETVFGWGLPDYANKLVIATGAVAGSYTCVDKGYILAVDVMGSAVGGPASISINGTVYSYVSSGATNYYNTINAVYGVDKGDVIDYSMPYQGNNNAAYIYFLPIKGV